MKRVIVIGSGFAGMSAAAYLAKEGCEVTILEKNATAGGRGRKMETDGYTFDMGPSWYWMPDVFENFFAAFGKKVSDYYSLTRLDPSYRIYWSDDYSDVPANYDELRQWIEKLEPGAAVKLDQFLKEAAYKYDVGMNRLVKQPGLSLTEWMNADFIKGVFHLDVFTSMSKHIRRFFKHPKIIQWLEFPVLFLGALPSNMPALYSLMNFADIKLGTWYPMGGMSKIAEAMATLAMQQGVTFLFNANVKKVILQNNSTKGVEVEINGTIQQLSADVVIGAGDYHHMESLLPPINRNYTETYWDKRVMAPSCLLYYVGVKKRVEGICHHNLFFDADFEAHGRQIYTQPDWPDNPLFYVCAPSVTDETVAPQGCENLFFLVPVAAGLQNDTELLRKAYFNKIVARFEAKTGQVISDHITYYKSYSVSDFQKDYNAFKGNAYGLANTLMQTAFLKPSIKNKKVKNLFYAGQLSVPGPGVPPSIISGEIVAAQVLKTKNY